MTDTPDGTAPDFGTSPYDAPPVTQPKRKHRWLAATLVGVFAFFVGVGVDGVESDTTAATAEPEPAKTVTVTATVPAVPQDQLDAIAARESELDQREAGLDAREADLDTREVALAEQERAEEPVPPASAPEPAGDCHPSYEPCVTIASDVDCLGGGGDGPGYTGRVRVTGPDEYGLDRNGDGFGCEAS